MRERIGLLVLSMMATCMLPNPAMGAGSDDEIEVLKGLQKIAVVVAINDGARDTGLTAQKATSNVETSLRKAGIKLGTQKDLDAVLAVQIEAFPLKAFPGVSAFSISVDLREVVLVTRTKKVIIGITWSSGTYGVVGSSREDELNRWVIGQIDIFLNDHAKANP